MNYDYEKMTAEELNILSDKYLHGAEGIEQDAATAAAIAKIAADRGDAKALCNYGSFLMEGVGVDKDETAAAEYWSRSADQGFAPALNKIGLCRLNGLCGMEKDVNKAVECFRKAADDGLADSMFHLAMLYEGGLGVEKDEIAARRYLEMAARSEVPIACLMLALKKFGVKDATPADQREGAALLLTAAEGGNQQAQTMYAMCCENGIGVEKDLAEAAGWYRRAAKAGSTQANDALKRLGFPGVR